MEEIKYDQMKDSGIEWIGNIPKEWDLIPLKQVASFKTGGTPPLSEGVNFEKGLPWFKPSDFSADISLLSNSENFINFESVKRNRINVFPRNTLLMITIASIGRVGLLEQDSYSNQQITALTIKDQNKLLPKYLLYVSGTLAKYLKESTMSSVVPIVNINFLSSCKVPMPNINEQINIVDYLENELKKIENIIDKAKRSLKLLNKIRKSIIFEAVTKGLDNNVEMKDSGVEWIGNIPKKWNIIKLRYLVSIGTEKGSIYENKNYVGLENISSGTGKYVKTESTVDDLSNNKFYNGNILFGKLRPYLKKIWQANFDGVASSEFIIFKDSKLKNRYLYWTLFSDNFLENVDSSTYGTKMPRASWEYIKNILVTVPTENEQFEIANYLDEKIGKIDDVISKLEKIISLAEKIKKSLIYEYATGKKRVRL